MNEIRDMVDRIKAVYLSADQSQIERGNSWYPFAHDLAEQIGHGDVRMGAGILAALSANKYWEYTVDLAFDASMGNVHGHTEAMLNKVRAILNGADPETVLPMHLKTGMFFQCIVDPTDPNPVVIDRWAWRTATGERDRTVRMPNLDRRNRYQTLADAYRIAAGELGDIAQRVQARCWVVAKDNDNL